MSQPAAGDHGPRWYAIRVKGHLGSRWATWFDGLSLTTERDGTTTIQGPVVDQAALHGVLQRVRDVGLPLLAVAPVEPDQLDQPATAPRPRTAEETAMTTTAPTTSARGRAPMSSLRRTALVAGVLYVLTFVSIPTLALYGAVKAPGYVTGPGPDTPALLGGALEMIVALAGIGTAVVLYPVLKRQNQSVALAFVGTRVLEAATIFAGVASLLTIVTLRQAGAGAEASGIAQALVAQYDWLFRLGQSTIPAANALLLGSLLYRSRLVPRVLPLLGFVGAPLLIASNVGTVLGLWGQISTLTALAALPIAVWEFSLGVYLIVKGFRPAPLTAGMVAGPTAPAAPAGAV